MPETRATPLRPQKVLYTAEAVVEGGRARHGRTSESRLEVDVSVPAEMSDSGDPSPLMVPPVLPVTRRLQALFASRVARVPGATRRLLLAAALDGSGISDCCGGSGSADGPWTILDRLSGRGSLMWTKARTGSRFGIR